jgi:hypothetical protein
MLVNIIIPVYSPTLSLLESDSLTQCLRVLKNYPITLVTHPEVDVTVYEKAFMAENKPFRISYFDKTYFESVFTYSQLLLSKDFYGRFSEFDYMLVYQLDGYVFRDELEAWCNKGYDYIGAPWLKKYGIGYDGNELWKVGNGGVSLRKTAKFLNTFDQAFPYRSIGFFIKSIRKKQLLPMTLRTFGMMFTCLFSRQTVADILNRYFDERVNEDCFWAEAFQATNLALNIPDVLTAAHFCIEKKPSHVFELIGRQLPFCCHAFEKYEYESFWKEHIEETRKTR